MAARAPETPAGEWIRGFKYDDTKLAEGRPLNRLDLDEAVPDHPAVVGHRGGHTSVYNSRAFALAGVTAETPDPEGGKFYREDGELTGLTSFHDAGTSSSSLRAYQAAYRAGELSTRVHMMLRGPYNSLREAGVSTGFGDDGSASERTMRMSTPYVGRPDDYGILTMSQEEIHEVVERAHRSNWQVGIYANGDVNIDMVLNAYERVQEDVAASGSQAPHGLDAREKVGVDQGAVLESAPSPPPYPYAHNHGNKWVEYGPEKMEWMFAHRSFLDHGIPVAPASDYTPGPYEPLMAIQSMVTRKDFNGRV